MPSKLHGGVRCSAGFGSLTTAVRGRTPSVAVPRKPAHHRGRAEQHRPRAPCRPTSEATHHRHTQRRAAPTTHGHYAEHHRPAITVSPYPATPTRTSRRRAAPAPTGTTRSPTRGVHPRGPHATAAARALLHAMVAERKAHLHRHHTMSGASRISRRCQVQRRVRLAHVRGSGAHAPRRASADARGTDAAERSTTDPTRRVAAHRRPATTAPRGDEPRRPPAGTTRSTPDPNRRVPTRIPATPNRTSRRRAAPAPTGTLRSPTRGVHPRGPHAHRRTGAPAREGGRT
ncbi:hypothetical protein GobsT_37270 [Gemmata obscuriglobus]|nr:hypothetical protein GobsT_37270 [Gemmata obscuriglobus]VTS07451.1 unnamed protein product [Gemmata obscuriglobus UQM 2246]